MDNNLAILAWILGTGGFCGFLGAIFGGVVGAIHWKKGNATGTIFGLEVYRAFERAADEELPIITKGAIIGAVDGLIFLGVLGTLVSAIVVYTGGERRAVLVPMMLTLLALMGGAVFFGSLAYGIHRAGIGALVGVFVGGTCGGLLGFLLAGQSGLIAGCVGGIALGNLVALVWQRFSKR